MDSDDYDDELHMWRDRPRTPSEQRLRFVRHLVATGQLQGDTAPDPSDERLWISDLIGTAQAALTRYDGDA